MRIAAVTKGGVGPFSDPVKIFIPVQGESRALAARSNVAGTADCHRAASDMAAD